MIDPHDVYAANRPGKLSAAVAGFPERIYVPISGRHRVDVIDPHTFKVVDQFEVGRQPQHVTPSYDLKTLWVLNDLGDSVTRIDPATGHKLDTINVKDPYNMYYTPDGKYAIVVAERTRRLDFRDAKTLKLVDSVPVPCRGVDHADFSADGRYLIASCEFSGQLVKLDVTTRALLGTLSLPAHHSMPQDVAAHARRQHLLRRGHGSQRCVRNRRRQLQVDWLHTDRRGCARARVQSRLDDGCMCPTAAKDPSRPSTSERGR